MWDHPQNQVVDHAVYRVYKEALHFSGMTYQIILPDENIQIIAETEIQTRKDNFINVISGTAATFRLHLWCQIFPQA